MIVNKGKEDWNVNAQKIPRRVPIMGRMRSLMKELDVIKESPNSLCEQKHVVIVMDALKEFSTKPLKWALENIIKTGYSVTLLGVMPWLSLPLSCKTWLDIWTLDLEDMSTLKERCEWKNDSKYQKVRAIVELCETYGVVPFMKLVMGHPVRLVVLEQTSNLHAAWVVFDRHQRKRRRFFRERIPCNMVMMNADGQVDMLKVMPILDGGDTGTSRASSAFVPQVPELITSEECRGVLEKESKREVDKDQSHR